MMSFRAKMRKTTPKYSQKSTKQQHLDRYKHQAFQGKISVP